MQIISLITDFGDKDYYLAELKASVYTKCKDVVIIDISHDIPVYDISLAAYQMKYMMKSLPAKSINILSVNNYYDTHPRYIIMEHDDKYFIAPDNGILSLLVDRLDTVFEIDISTLSDKRLSNIYGHAIACLHHNLPLEEFSRQINDVDQKFGFMPVVTQNQIKATILHVDQYGNVITNCSKLIFEKSREGRSFAIYYKPGEPIRTISNHYGEVNFGEAVALFNNADYLELAINMDNASKQLHLHKNETIQIDFY
jgi:S-adenosyl-L-methionine hydrolase (adenosine-forming)